MLITSDHGRATRASRSSGRGFAPIVLVALAAWVVPLAAPLVTFGSLAQSLQGTINTQFGSLVAAVAAYLILRRVTIYPGTRAFSFIVPAFSTTFGLASVILLGFRLDYSGSMLLTGYVSSTAAAFLLGYLGMRASAQRMYYVPVGNIGIVADTPAVDWVPLTTPVLPDDDAASIVADLRSDHSPEWERMLARAAIAGIPVYHTKQLRESLTGRVQIEHLSENSFGSLLPGLGYRGVKRVIDIAASVVVLPVLILPLLGVALLVRVSSPRCRSRA
ncbi:MAG: hypothetical protein EOP89_11405 [Lysobacteraceae bacterium]|nr:MAG: hypothetical protein EOP89_11405 [Xanthomonadaceae bacterium]